MPLHKQKRHTIVLVAPGTLIERRFVRNQRASPGVSFHMKLSTFLALLLVIGLASLHSQSTNEPIDFQKARALLHRRQSGEQLSAGDQAYLQRAMAARSGKAGRAANQRKAPEHLTPLCDMSATDRYEGEDGGLYGAGQNTPPDAHRKTALAQLARIRPLNAAGQPDDKGTIGFVAISMSNATQEFSKFKQVADQSPRKSPKVTIVDCAQGGQAMAEWAPPDARPWTEAKRRLEAARVSPQQVQVAWIKLANKTPGGSLQEHGRKLERDTLAVLHNARALFPNLRSRISASPTSAAAPMAVTAARSIPNRMPTKAPSPFAG